MEVSLLVGSDLNPGSEIESDALNFAKLLGLLDDSSLPSLLVRYSRVNTWSTTSDIAQRWSVWLEPSLY